MRRLMSAQQPNLPLRCWIVVLALRIKLSQVVQSCAEQTEGYEGRWRGVGYTLACVDAMTQGLSWP